MFFSGLTLLALSALASAQSDPTLVNATNGAITVHVGGNSSDPNAFRFKPANIAAPNGTVITFVWDAAPGNHSVTQSTFAAPCQPDAGGFDSGVVFIPAGTAAADAPTWNLTVTDDTQILWFYCKQVLPGPHCNAGMVGGINVPQSGDHSFVTFQNNADTFANVTGIDEPGSDGTLPGISATGAPAPLTASGVSALSPPASGSNTPAPTLPSSTTSSTSSTSTGGGGNGAMEVVKFGFGKWLAVGASVFLGVLVV